MIILLTIFQLVLGSTARYCEDGYYAYGRECAICPKGRFCPGDDSSYLCKPGQYMDINGATECYSTPANSYTDALGQVNYIKCAAGQYALEGSISCTGCDISIIVVNSSAFIEKDSFVPTKNTNFTLNYNVSKNLWGEGAELTSVAVTASYYVEEENTAIPVQSSLVNGTYNITKSPAVNDTLEIRLNFNRIDDVNITLTADCEKNYTFQIYVQKCFEGCGQCDTRAGRYKCETCVKYEDKNIRDQYSNDGVCERCPSGCSTCDKKVFSSKVKCRECIDGYYLYGEQCDTKCPNGYYPNDEDNTCEKCDKWCKTCYGPSRSQCFTCKSPYKIKINTCTSEDTIVAQNIAQATTQANIGVSSASAGTSAVSSVAVSSSAVPTGGAANIGKHLIDIGGAQSAQLFWVMFNDYQMIAAFLLIDVDYHDALAELCKSVNFATANLNKIGNIPIIEDAKKEIRSAYGKRGEEFMDKRRENASLEDNIFISDYMYFLIALPFLLMLPFVFTCFIVVPKNPKTYFQNFLVTVYKYLHFGIFIRFLQEAYFFGMISIFSEFKRGETSDIAFVSMTIGSITLIFLYLFTVWVIYHYIYHRNDESIVNGPYQVLYEGLKGSRYAKLYSSFFLIRRAFLAFVLVFIPGGSAQVILAVGIQLSALLYLAIIQPFDSLEDNIINLINEIVIVFCTAFFMIFTLGKLDANQTEDITLIIIYIISFTGIICFFISAVFVTIMVLELIRDWRKKRAEMKDREQNDGDDSIKIDNLSRHSSENDNQDDMGLADHISDEINKDDD